MKKTFKLKNLALSLAVAGAASVAMVPAASQAGVSANVGFVSDYIWRGIKQGDTKGEPALQGGLDYEHDSGLFIGGWASTVTKGYEYDLYAGWGGSFNGVDLGAAYTSYMYTDDAKDNGLANFEEVNLSAGYSFVSVGYDIDVTKGSKSTHYSITLDAGSIAEGISLTYGSSNTNTSGSKAADYLDFGYSTTLDMGVDLGVNVIASGNQNQDTTYFVVGMSKTFDLM